MDFWRAFRRLFGLVTILFSPEHFPSLIRLASIHLNRARRAGILDAQKALQPCAVGLNQNRLKRRFSGLLRQGLFVLV